MVRTHRQEMKVCKQTSVKCVEEPQYAILRHWLDSGHKCVCVSFKFNNLFWVEVSVDYCWHSVTIDTFRFQYLQDNLLCVEHWYRCTDKHRFPIGYHLINISSFKYGLFSSRCVFANGWSDRRWCTRFFYRYHDYRRRPGECPSR